MHWNVLFVCVVVFGSLQMDMYGAIKLHVTPSRFTGENGQTVVPLDCKLDAAEEAAKEILVLKISRKGARPIAILHPGNRITWERGTKEEFQVSGKIEEEEAASKSHMMVTILRPGVDDSGSYTCVVNYIDESGKMVEDVASSYLTVDDPKIKEMQTNVQRLLAWIKKKDEQLAELEKGSSAIAFSAANSQALIYPKNDTTLVFPDVIMNQGQGYDPGTGVFTAPQDGLYAFHLTAEIACRMCRVRVRLVANSRVLVNLKAGDGDQANQASVSTAVKLVKGDKVKAVTTFATLASFLTNQKYTMFTGYRISP